jgi:hypothetical protein
MLETGDIEHVESIINERFPLQNCGSWNRIKNELAEALKPSHNSAIMQLSCKGCCNESITDCYSCVRGNKTDLFATEQ